MSTPHRPTEHRHPRPRSEQRPNHSGYYAPHGGHPPQTELLTDRAMFTEAYAVIPRGVMRDIVTSYLPFWDETRLWVIARPLSGFAETFSQYIVEVAPGGGSDRPELDPGAEGVLFVVEGHANLTIDGEGHRLDPGGYAFLPPGATGRCATRRQLPLRFHWIRKAYEAVDGLEAPAAFVTNERDVSPIAMPGTDGRWVTTRFVDPADMRHDMHVNIVTFEPGAVDPVRGDPRDGARPLRARGQGRLPAEPATGSRCRRATSCGCAPSARRPATPAARDASATCSTRTSTGTPCSPASSYSPRG